MIKNNSNTRLSILRKWVLISRKRWKYKKNRKIDAKFKVKKAATFGNILINVFSHIYAENNEVRLDVIEKCRGLS